MLAQASQLAPNIRRNSSGGSRQVETHRPGVPDTTHAHEADTLVKTDGGIVLLDAEAERTVTFRASTVGYCIEQGRADPATACPASNRERQFRHAWCHEAVAVFGLREESIPARPEPLVTLLSDHARVTLATPARDVDGDVRIGKHIVHGRTSRIRTPSDGFDEHLLQEVLIYVRGVAHAPSIQEPSHTVESKN